LKETRAVEYSPSVAICFLRNCISQEMKLLRAMDLYRTLIIGKLHH